MVDVLSVLEVVQCRSGTPDYISMCSIASAYLYFSESTSLSYTSLAFLKLKTKLCSAHMMCGTGSLIIVAHSTIPPLHVPLNLDSQQM